MKFLWTALILATASGCVSVGDIEGRPIGFDAYLAEERGGYTPLADSPAPVQSASVDRPTASSPTMRTNRADIPTHRVVAAFSLPSAEYKKVERASKSSFTYGSTQKGRTIYVADKTWVLKFVTVRGYDFAIIKPKGFWSKGGSHQKIVPDLFAATMRETSCNMSTLYTQRTYKNGGPTQYSFHLMC